MNKTKRTLLLISGILSLVEAGIILILLFNLNSLLNYAFKSMEQAFSTGQLPYEQITEQEMQFVKTFLTILFAIFTLFMLLAGIFTLVSISDPQRFISRRGLYITGAVFTILSGPISISSILYYISFAIKEPLPNQISASLENITDDSSANDNLDQLERKIKLLRNLKEREEITPEEFRKRLSDLLDKK